MRYKQYLNESNKITDFQTILEILWNKCNPFLKDLLKGGKFTGDFLYSGRRTNKDVFVRGVREDRSPTDMDYDLYEMFDKEFYYRFGFKARSNAIFCTGNLHTAKDYNDNVYMIFPMDNYEFVYSEDIPDLYTHTKDEFGDESKDDWIEDHMDDALYKYRDAIIEDYESTYTEGSQNGHWEYFDTNDSENYILDSDIEDREDAIEELETNHNIEDVNDAYLNWIPDMEQDEFVEDELMSYRSDAYEDLEREWNDFIESQVEDIVRQYSDSDINNAISSGSEIMIHTRYYIGIDYDKYYKVISSYYKTNGYQEPNTVKIKNWYIKNKGRLPKQLELFNTKTKGMSSGKYVDTILGKFKL